MDFACNPGFTFILRLTFTLGSIFAFVPATILVTFFKKLFYRKYSQNNKIMYEFFL